MSYFTIGYRLPYFLSKRLFGDRRNYGLSIKSDDPHWQEWERVYLKVYYNNQKRSIGAFVNNAGYKVMSRIKTDGRSILEIGPGDISHMYNWRGLPTHYTIADIQQEVLDISAARLNDINVPYTAVLLGHNASWELPFEDEKFDIIVLFYSMEHLHPLPSYLDAMIRVLKRDGTIIGAIPCEGGLAWGIGRFLTSRRWLKKNTTVNPDKIICWEHPNFADIILKTLDLKMRRRYLAFWPFGIPSIDMNLIIKFIYEKY